MAQETRGWSEAEQRTFPQRSKEYADDYRYFPEPDLPPLEISLAWVDELRASIPELPAPRRRRLIEQFEISEYDADQLTAEGETADLFEATVAAGSPAKQAANWIVGTRPTLEAEPLAELIDLVTRGTINREQGMQVLEESQASGLPPAEIVARRGLAQISDEATLGSIIELVLEGNPQVVADFKAGKPQALRALLGKVKAASGGSANMVVASKLLLKRLRDRAP